MWCRLKNTYMYITVFRMYICSHSTGFMQHQLPGSGGKMTRGETRLQIVLNCVHFIFCTQMHVSQQLHCSTRITFFFPVNKLSHIPDIYMQYIIYLCIYFCTMYSLNNCSKCIPQFYRPGENMHVSFLTEISRDAGQSKSVIQLGCIY